MAGLKGAQQKQKLIQVNTILENFKSLLLCIGCLFAQIKVDIYIWNADWRQFYTSNRPVWNLHNEWVTSSSSGQNNCLISMWNKNIAI